MSSESALKPKRVAISKRLRFEVFKRDGFECQYCGATPPGVMLHCDHVEPVAAGGKTEMDNLVTACEACNLGKGAISLSSVPQSMADRASEIAEREEQIAGYQSVLRARRDRLENEAQEVLNYLCDHFSRDGIPKQDFTTIKNFIDKLGLVDVLDSAEIACGKFYSGYARGFRYFCGICWGKIKQRDIGA